MQTTDKVQTGESTTGTSTSTTYTYKHPSHYIEKGWECPRCGRINAPWLRQCDCNVNNWQWPWGDKTTARDDWWKDYVTCAQADTVGGSDYWDSFAEDWVNVLKTCTNSVKR